MKYIFYFLAILATFAIVNHAMNVREVVECNQWKDQATIYPLFYLTEWQAEQCAAHNIIINAPIQ